MSDKEWNPGFPFCIKHGCNGSVFMVERRHGLIVFQCEGCQTKWKSEQAGQLEEITGE